MKGRGREEAFDTPRLCKQWDTWTRPRERERAAGQLSAVSSAWENARAGPGRRGIFSMTHPPWSGDQSRNQFIITGEKVFELR